MLTKKKTVAFDFDGVIHSYESGWQGVDVIPDPPVPGIKKVIDNLREDGYNIVIYSTRCSQESGRKAIIDWLDKYNIHVNDISAEKPVAFCYVDDRAINFRGRTDKLYQQIIDFKSWIDVNKNIVPRK